MIDRDTIRSEKYELTRTETSIELRSNRLLIRAFRDADIRALIEYLSCGDPMVERVMGIQPTAEAITEYWQPMSETDPFGDPQWLSMLIELSEEKKVIGNVGYGITVIDPMHKLGSIGWSLSSAYRSRGIATEAAQAVLGFVFDHLDVHRVHARTGLANAPSWRLMERLGMRREAHFREGHTNLAGQWDDEFIYAILKKEWIAA
ncbi:GNAT family N-acetyltransferase [Candidatus Bipolaricaulota bacterium]